MVILESPVTKTFPGVSAFTTIGFSLVPNPSIFSLTLLHSPLFKTIVVPSTTFLMALLNSSILSTLTFNSCDNNKLILIKIKNRERINLLNINVLFFGLPDW